MITRDRDGPYTIVRERLNDRRRATSTSYDFEVGPVPPGELWELRNLSAEDEDNAATEIRVITKAGTTESVHFEQNSPAAATLYWIEYPIWALENETLIVRFTGVTSGDDLRVDGLIARYITTRGER